VTIAEGLDLGLHIDLGEWIFRNGDWQLLYQRVPFDDVNALEEEIRGQLDEFRSLARRDPTHLDSHQHVHLNEPVRSLAKQLADELSVPLRGVTPHVKYCGSFYGQTGKGDPCPESISLPSMIMLIRQLPSGVTELGCHPACNEERGSIYCFERALELQVLCHPQVQKTIEEENIQLRTFAQINATTTLQQPQ
jgi:chitin disaccharide deacetylase